MNDDKQQELLTLYKKCVEQLHSQNDPRESIYKKKLKQYSKPYNPDSLILRKSLNIQDLEQMNHHQTNFYYIENYNLIKNSANVKRIQNNHIKNQATLHITNHPNLALKRQASFQLKKEKILLQQNPQQKKIVQKYRFLENMNDTIIGEGLHQQYERFDNKLKHRSIGFKSVHKKLKQKTDILQNRGDCQIQKEENSPRISSCQVIPSQEKPQGQKLKSLEKFRNFLREVNMTKRTEQSKEFPQNQENTLIVPKESELNTEIQ